MKQLINQKTFNNLKQIYNFTQNTFSQIGKMGNTLRNPSCSSNYYLPPEQLYKNENYKEALQYEKNLLELSGLKVGKDIKIQDIEVNKEKDIVIHSYNVKKDENKKNILLVHGYMSCGASYYKMLQQLSQEFNIYAIDIPGMGLSSRPKFDYGKDNVQQNLDFFINSIDTMTEKLNLNKFTLVGHSFGGYISAQYALSHPQKIENLFLLSPLGVTARSEQERQQIAQKQQNSAGFVQRQVLNYLKNGFHKGDTLQNISNKLFIPTDYILRKWTNYWFPKEDDIQGRDNMLGYIKNILKLPTSSDKALNNMFYVERISAKIPLETALVYSPINTYFYYGSKDWMCKIGAERLQMRNSKKGLDIIQDAGHNLQLDQPIQLANDIIAKSKQK